jgi:RNA polymerase sigma factor (sigma-70 family)
MAKPNAASAAGAEDLTDEALLEHFTSQREEAAFAVLVRRYGRLVLGVCRRVLHHEQDAEDAAQAVFCILARRARSIRKRGAVGAWLHAVAYRIARKAQARRGRRPVPTTNLADIPATEDSLEWTWREVRPILDEEVNRLPEKYRQAFVLCYLEGRTNEQAATHLGCPLGTVLSRLSRAREQLRRRLTRRGLVLSVGALTVAVTREADAVEMPPRLTKAAFRAALASTGGSGSAGVLSSRVSALTTEYLQSRSQARRPQARRPQARRIRVAIVLLAVILLCLVLLLLLRRPVIALLRKGASAPPAQTDQQLLQGTWRESRVEMGESSFQTPTSV